MKVTEDEIRAIISGVDSSANVESLNEDMDFSDIGIDSLESFNILLGVEEKFGVTLPEDEELNSIAAIISFLEKN